MNIFDNITPAIRNTNVATSGTSTQVCSAVSGGLVRSQLIFTNTHDTAVITIAKGDIAAVSTYGIKLSPGQSYLESTDSGFKCWQGAVQAVSDVAGTLAIVESFQ